MKKLIIVLVVAVLGIAGLQSCKKEHNHQPPTVTNLNVTLKQNETYTFTLPANTTPKPYRITSQAGHYTVSLASKDASGNETYQYTPALNYTGTDKVTVEDTKAEGCNGGNPPPPQNGGSCSGGHHGHCGDDGDEDDVKANIVNINFIISGSNSATAHSSLIVTPSF